MINTLLFDLDNTLINSHKALELCVKNIDENAYQQFLSKGAYQNKDDLQLRNQLFKALTKKTNRINLQADFQQYLLETIKPDQKIIDCLSALGTHFKMAIVSNGKHKIQRQKIKKAGLNSVFKHYFISGQKGIRKPHAALFQQALKQLKSKPENTLFIGDSLENDIAGAASLGMKTCWINTHKIPADYSIKPTYIIRCLYEIEGVLLNE